MAAAPADKPSPPPAATIFAMYLIVGSAASFICGRDPGALPTPEDLIHELCPSIAVVCFFLTSYSVYDCMAAGVTKAAHGYEAKLYKDLPAQMPEEVFLAERAQMNQIEQLPSFLMGTTCFSILVNGHVGALLALTWTILRRLYARRYRQSVGLTLGKGLATFTLPCYFIVNTMLMGSAVHALRWVMV